MKAKFIEDGDLQLGLQFEPETDDERLLLRAFAYQANEVDGRMKLTGWGIGGPQPGMRHVSLRLEQAPKDESRPRVLHPVGQIACIQRNVAILKDATDASKFQRGDVLALSWAAEGTSADPVPFRVGRLVVAEVNRVTGELTFTRPVHDEVAAAVGHDDFGDWLYRVEWHGEE